MRKERKSRIQQLKMTHLSFWFTSCQSIKTSYHFSLFQFPQEIWMSGRTNLSMSICTTLIWAQQAAAWRGVQHSVSRAFTFAPRDTRRVWIQEELSILSSFHSSLTIISTLSSMAHWWSGVSPSSLCELGSAPRSSNRPTIIHIHLSLSFPLPSLEKSLLFPLAHLHVYHSY